MRDAALALWTATPAEMPRIAPPVGCWRQISNARAAARLIDELASEITRLPDGAAARRERQSAVRERLQRFGHERLGWPDGYRRLLFGEAFYDAAVAFAREAQDLEPRLSLAQLGQALRNVWIGNSLQMLLDRPVEMRHGLFAYSMLYPLTDNWLDDPAVPHRHKRDFSARFALRLAGHRPRPLDRREASVFAFVGRIENELPRADFPGVYESLLAIHRGQSRSLEQQENADLGEATLLSISFEKGGCSVLADLHLVLENASPDQERFAFGYGVFLQLLDDLQDVDDDLAVGHQTLFTRAARTGVLDRPTARLARFVDRVLERNTLVPATGECTDRLDLIQRNCRALLVGSVAKQPRRFSLGFRRQLAAQWPVSFRAHCRLRRRALRHWTRLAPRVEAELRAIRTTTATAAPQR